ncbi:cation:proton antiporter domain-containing protein [Stakelama tenebrarum]|uniref:Sodium:proton exchanger n=1 Tax=Stakelama tenebrarum TaxID=2711215 RepID=A0A6G6Y7Y9_9SPHN|nr:cation:proton antiporter [Sphingosinithalassobacter tenebrarum]QIG81029.1 sodium:proton exchanger [Sphingosinithalassobacter tenebrarum]
MEHHAGTALLTDAAPILGFALFFVLLFRKFGLGATLGYLVAGAMVGPQVLGIVGDAEDKMGIAELGIALLLFIVGLELSPSRLWRMRSDIFGFGFLQVILCGLVITAIIGVSTRFSWAAALALGLPLALSSTAQVLPMLQSAGRLRTPVGERAFSTLLFQDLSIVPLITIVAAMSRNPADAGGPPGWQLGLYTLLAVGGLVLVGRYLLRPLFRLIGNLGEREMFIFAGLFVVIAASALMHALGLSIALGAFVAGVMLADSPYRHQIEADVEPFRSILIGLFFVAVGMSLDLGAIAERPVFVAGMAAALIASKTLVITLLARAFHMPWRRAFATGLLLSQGGEFGFVLFAQAQQAMLIENSAASLFGAVVTLSMATTPFLMMATRRLRTEPEAAAREMEGPQQDGASAIIVGYGRFGQTVAQMLLGQGLTVTLIDRDVEMIETAGTFGMKVYYGDGTRLEILRQAGAHDAQLICFCIDGDPLDAEMLHGVRNAFPDATLFVRVYDRRSIMRIRGAPIEGAVREVFESAIVMARRAMAAVGVDESEIEKTDADYRDRDAQRLKIQKETGDIRAARDRMFTHATVAAARRGEEE